MLEANVDDWEKVFCRSVAEVIEVLDWRAQLARGSKQALEASNYVNLYPNQSKASFNEEEAPSALAACRSSQDLRRVESPLSEIKINMSVSHTLNLDFRKETETLVIEK